MVQWERVKCEGGMRDSGGGVRVMDGGRVNIVERWWWKGEGSGGVRVRPVEGGGTKMVQGP